MRPEEDVCQQRARSASVQMRDPNNGKLRDKTDLLLVLTLSWCYFQWV